MIRRNGPARVPAWSMSITAMLMIQLSNALSVGLIDRVGPAGTAWLRMCFGAVFLIAVARPSLRSIRRRDLPTLLALGVATGFMTTFFLAAVARIPLGTAVAVEFLGPLTVAGFASKRRKALVWPLLALVGVVLLTAPWQGDVDLVGVGFALLAGACWGTYNVLTQRIGDRFSGISGLSLTIPIAAIATAVFGIPEVVGGDFRWWILAAAAGIALITPVTSFGLEMLALRRMTHAAFGTLLAIEPAFAILIGLLILRQTPTVMQIVGIALVVVAGAAAQRGGDRTREPVGNEHAARRRAQQDPARDETPKNAEEAP
jgi:inner membrane transporter RhtA